MSRLFGPSFTTAAMMDATSDAAWLAAMLRFEAELAAAEAAVGVIPSESAALIADVCTANRYDIEQLGRDAAASATPVVPMLAALRAHLPAPARQHVHHAATSQDVLDTATMLVARAALDLVLDDLAGLALACADLAARHRDTVMAGRTLLQQATPITFGLKAAGWLMAIDASTDRLEDFMRHRLAVQFGGPSGTLDALGEQGTAVRAELARRLDLHDPPAPWHGDRTRIAELGAGLAIAGGAAGKIALDVVLLAQTEVAEVAEGAPGASSSMPRKRNPVAAVEADAAVRGLVAEAGVLFGCLRIEHERGAGSWQAEWRALTGAFRLAAGAVARTRTALEGLEIDTARMRQNLAVEGGLGSAGAFVDRALAAHRARSNP
jgi:3-carboxy-cis,cis-muconate cycloisomerase